MPLSTYQVTTSHWNPTQQKGGDSKTSNDNARLQAQAKQLQSKSDKTLK
jgi:hypothetical protein